MDNVEIIIEIKYISADNAVRLHNEISDKLIASIKQLPAIKFTMQTTYDKRVLRTSDGGK